MRPKSAAAVFALAAFAALASAGDEAVKHEVEFKDHWKAGQVVTITDHETSDMDTTMGEATLQSEHEVLDAIYVVRCDAADAQDKPVKQTVFIKSWKQTKGEATDESITGARVEVDGKTWKLSDGKTAGALAKKWLDKKFTKGDDNPFEKLVPPKMAVGETWKPDPKVAADAFSKSMEDAPFDAAGVEMTVTLVSVDGTPPDEVGKFTVKLHLPMSDKVPGMPPGSIVAKGSGAEMVGERSGPMKGATMLGAEHMDMDLTMNVTMPKEAGGASVSVKGKMVEDKKTVAGGEIPELPKPATSAPGGK